MSARAPGLELADASVAVRLAREVDAARGRVFVVGGWIRDRLLGRPAGDLDLEVHGLSRAALEEALLRFGPLRRVGAAFPVHLLGRESLQVGFVEADRPADGDFAGAFAEASRRRDLTINSLGWDPLRDELLDPHAGRDDLAARSLRATDAQRFGEDPLRVLRVARLAAELDFTPTPELVALCRGVPLEQIASERIYEEMCRLLSLERPGRGLEWLRSLDALRVLPEVARMIDVPQDPRWHPEGCVFVHTVMVLDAAAQLRTGDPRADLELAWAALCHDLGKVETTRIEDGAVRSPGHDLRGAESTRALLLRLRAPKAVADRVAALVRHHLAPVALVSQRAGGRAYRRLARALADAGLDVRALERLARADQLGRTTPAAKAGRFPEGAAFLEEAERHALSPGPANRDVVQGRHVRARGGVEGPEIGRILRRCRELQDELGLVDPQQILDRVMREEAD